MNINEMISAIRIAYSAGEPTMLRGAPGIGKSSGLLAACAQLAKQLGLKGGVWQWGDEVSSGLTIKDYFGFIDMRVADKDPVDIGGLPDKCPITGTMTRLVPSWFPSVNRADFPDFGILALEEVVSAPPSVQAACYQLTNDRRSNDVRMKDGWGMVLTGNRMTDGGVVYKMPTPLGNRLTHLDIESNFDSWRAHALENDFDMSVVAFVGFRPDLLNTFEEHVKKKLSGDAFATERTWEKASKYVRVPGTTDAELLPLLAGVLSEGVAAEFYGFRKVWQSMPSIDGILLDPANAPIPKDAASQYAVAVALGHRATADLAGVILTYAERYATELGRPELMALCVKDAVRRCPAIYSTREFTVWASTNGHYLQ